jgi:HSP20 family molecular chaperone IbpA
MPEAQGQGSQPNTESMKDTPRPRGGDGERRPFENASFNAPRQARGGDVTTERSSYLTTPEIWRETWRPLATIQAEMARWFDDVWREAASNRAGYISTTRGLPDLAGGTAFTGLPRADLKETDKDYRLHVELPGLKVADVQLELDGDALVVRGLKSDDHDAEAANFHITERRFGRVERRFALPRDVDHTAVKADFRDGVLNVTLPKDAAAEQRRRIEVRPG